ncbi:MAG: sulfatase-like hydrolase/transferase, partial [Planctomycetota bacterium]
MTTAEKAGGNPISLRPIVLTVLIASVSFSASAYAASPNFIFILVDDLGYTDINCPGDGDDLDTKYYKTPNIAKLRAKGTRFTNAYVTAPFCKPTRASIMTGKYVERLAISNLPAVRLGLYETTIAEALDAGGTDYLSASVGKWSLSSPSGTPQPGSALPNRQGFDYNYGGSGRFKPNINREGRFEKGDDIEGWDPNDYPGLGDPNNDPCLNEYLADSITT